MAHCKIIRKSVLTETVGLSISTIRRMIQRGEFPAPVKLSAQAVGWRLEEVQAWVASREAV
jgi:prophage regulatory protein